MKNPFKRHPWKSNNELNVGGFSPYLTDDEVNEYVNHLEAHHAKLQRETSIKQRALLMRYEKSFKIFIHRFLKNQFIFLLILGEQSQSDSIIRARANSLLKNKSLQYQYGPYLIECAVHSHFASIFYSLDQGLSFQRNGEIELRGGFEDYLTQLSEMIVKTEKILAISIRDKRAPK